MILLSPSSALAQTDGTGVQLSLARIASADLVQTVRRQSFWDNGLGKLREALAHRCGDVRRTAGGAAVDGWQWSVV
jgi:hypothetical protein